MTPEQSREDQASEVPLYERLRSIPADLRVTIPIQWAEDGAETGHRFIPIGNMAHRAAATVLEVEWLKIAEQIILASIPEEYLADTVAGSAQNYIAHLEKRAERAERRAERLKGHAEALLEQLRTMRIHFVSTLESARERIIWNGGECDSVEKMEADDPYLKSSWKVMEAYRAEFKGE